MQKIYYDLHIHSCLSPCGDMEMTPYNLVNMAKLCGYAVIALTDHNTSKNCPAAGKAAKDAGILFLPGMELCTAEEIHVVCLFSGLDSAMAFDDFVSGHIPNIANNESVFGEQVIMDAKDSIIGREPRLLITATDIMIDEVPVLVKKYGGVSFPAHIDKDSNSILANLGDFPDGLGFTAAEIFDAKKTDMLKEKHPILKDLRLLHNSDAHRLGQIRDAANSMYVESLDARHVLKAIKQGDV